ncbi:helicase associated domain-containing protein [Streptomyces sp. NPDC006267]
MSSGSLARTRRAGAQAGAWIGKQRSRAAMLTPERMEKLSAIGMRWSS